jgi:hypothetical protein
VQASADLVYHLIELRRCAHEQLVHQNGSQNRIKQGQPISFPGRKPVSDPIDKGLGLSKKFELDKPFKLDLLFARIKLGSKFKQAKLKPVIRFASFTSSSLNIQIV